MHLESFPTQSPSYRRFRVALLGAGSISECHALTLRSIQHVELTAICDEHLGRAQDVANRTEAAFAFDSLTEMLERIHPHVVHILVPPPFHIQCALICLEAGSHVFIEKPLGINSAECHHLQTNVLRTGRRAGVNHNAAFHPCLLQLKNMIRERRFGEVQHVLACVKVSVLQHRAGQHHHWMFQTPGNIILEQAPHPLSQIQVLLGNVISASAQPFGQVELSTGVPFFNTWQISLHCERGTAQCLLAYGQGINESTLHVIGQDATAFIDLRRATIQLTEHARFMEPIENLRHSVTAATGLFCQGVTNFYNYALGFLQRKPPGDPFSTGFRASVGAFYAALASGERLPVTVADATAVVEACEKIMRSAAAGGQWR